MCLDNMGPRTAIIAKILWRFFYFVCLNQRQSNVCPMKSSACAAWSSVLKWGGRKTANKVERGGGEAHEILALSLL